MRGARYIPIKAVIHPGLLCDLQYVYRILDIVGVGEDCPDSFALADESRELLDADRAIELLDDLRVELVDLVGFRTTTADDDDGEDAKMST